MPRNLTRKHAPRKLEDLIGQDQAIEIAHRWFKAERPQPLLLIGASGTGKTTISRILGAMYCCEEDNKPCGECDHCVEVFKGRTVFGYSEINGAKFSSAQHAAQMTKYIEEALLWRWTTFIDEVHGLTKAGADVLLKPIEDPLRDVRVIFATTEPENVRRTLRGRCQILKLRTLNSADLFGLLARVCEKEGIRYEARALDMIAASAEGAARDALVQLDAIADFGDVTASLVADRLSMGSAASVLEYFRAVLNADIDAQEEAILQWPAPPSEITKLIRDFLLYLYKREASPRPSSDIVNTAFFEIVDCDRKQIASGFKELASRRRRAFSDFVLDMLEQWDTDHSGIVDRSSLMIKICRFDRLLYGDDEGPNPPSGSSLEASKLAYAEARPTRARSVRRLPGQSACHLNQSQCESLYEMASFLPQEHGVLLNTTLLFRLPVGQAGSGKVPKLISDLTHALAQRVKCWSNTPAHWIYVNAQDEVRVTTRLALHLPPFALEKLKPWLEAWCNGAIEHFAIEYELDAQAPNRAVGYDRNRFQRHWAIFRWLAGAVDPEILHWSGERGDRERQPLVDLLKVKPVVRYELGDLGKLNALGSSRSLAPNSRQRAADNKMQFLSAFADCAWDALPSGWELKEFEDRRSEIQKRAEQFDRLEKEYPSTETQLERDAYQVARESVEAHWPLDPRLRPRSWSGWW